MSHVGLQLGRTVTIEIFYLERRVLAAQLTAKPKGTKEDALCGITSGLQALQPIDLRVNRTPIIFMRSYKRGLLISL